MNKEAIDGIEVKDENVNPEFVGILESEEPKEEILINPNFERLDKKSKLILSLKDATVEFNGNVFKANRVSFNNLSSYFISMGDSCYWINDNNEDVTLSKSDVSAILKLMLEKIQECYKNYNAIRQ